MRPQEREVAVPFRADDIRIDAGRHPRHLTDTDRIKGADGTTRHDEKAKNIGLLDLALFSL